MFMTKEKRIPALFLAVSCMIVLSAPDSALAQGPIGNNENIDLLYLNPTEISGNGGNANPKNTPLWGAGNLRVDSVWLGAVFLRDTTEPFKVWFNIRDAGWVGSLSLFIPHGADGTRDTSIYLFNNDTTPNAVVDLTDNPIVEKYLEHLDTVYFKYVAPLSGTTQYIGYSGQNRGPGEGWSRTDYVYSSVKSTKTLVSPLGNTFSVGRRYCSAGWMKDISANTRTDTVQFAFEDTHSSSSDFDFNDIMFKVTGIDLVFPAQTIICTVRPNDTIRAGDTATIIGLVIDQLGNERPDLSNRVIWVQKSEILPGDWLRPTANDSTRFTATRAPYDPAGNPRRVLITAFLDGTALGSVTITVLPNIATQVRLEYPSGAVIPDTVNLSHPDGIINAYARLYDRFGNLIVSGDVTSNWTATPGLHRIPDSVGKTNIYYTTANVSKDERGYIKVTHNGFSDSVYLDIRGPVIQMTEATTQDLNGDGLLDHLVLHFSRPVTLSESFLTNNLKVSIKAQPNINYTFKIEDVLNTAGKADSVWVIKLNDTLLSGVPQTAWKPTVSLPADNALNLGATTALVSTDGAGPVVWSVTKKLVGLDKHNEDIVTVVYSEAITKELTNPLAVNDDPSKIFTVWMKDPNDPTKFIEVPDILTGLKLKEVRDTALVFRMTNGEDLYDLHYFSFDTANGGFVFDKAKGIPVSDNNQLVKVVVLIGPVGPMVAHPNPMLPTGKRVPVGVLDVVNQPKAPDWVKQDRSGVSMSMNFTAPTYTERRDLGVRVRCAVKIYDIAGNLVQSAKNDNFAADAVGSVVKAFLYWNGTNGKGMAAAPGVYRVVVFVQYWDNGSGAARKYADRRYTTKVGVGR